MDKLDMKPVYKAFAGWGNPISECRNWSDLPVEMNSYLEFINAYLGVKVTYVSNGPGRDQIICS